MNIKRYLLASLTGFVALIAASTLLEQVLLHDFLLNNVYEPAGVDLDKVPLWTASPLMLVILIMAYLYPKGYEGGTPAVESLRFGIMLGLFGGVPFGVYFGGMFSLDFAAIIMMSATYTVEIMAAGLAIGMAYGRSIKTA